MFLLPHKVKGFQPNWCSFSWFLGWAINTFSPAHCRYLEWGPGWSTSYAVLSGVANSNVYSVESEEKWYQQHSGLNVNLILRDGPKTEDVDEVVNPDW